MYNYVLKNLYTYALFWTASKWNNFGYYYLKMFDKNFHLFIPESIPIKKRLGSKCGFCELKKEDVSSTGLSANVSEYK